MQASSIPTSFPATFANGAGSSYIRTIPTASMVRDPLIFALFPRHQ